MNAAHKVGRKLNRLKRLVRRVQDCPADQAKLDRKNCLLFELNKVGVKV